MRKIPGTESTPITTPADFQEYALHLADDRMMTGRLAMKLLLLAAGDVQWERPAGPNRWAKYDHDVREGDRVEVIGQEYLRGEVWKVTRYPGRDQDSVHFRPEGEAVDGFGVARTVGKIRKL